MSANRDPPSSASCGIAPLGMRIRSGYGSAGSESHSVLGLGCPLVALGCDGAGRGRGDATSSRSLESNIIQYKSLWSPSLGALSVTSLLLPLPAGACGFTVFRFLSLLSSSSCDLSAATVDFVDADVESSPESDSESFALESVAIGADPSA